MRKRRVAKPVREIRYEGLFDALDFMGLWSPPQSEFERSRARWLSLDEYLGHYGAVREAFLADYERLRAERIAASQRRIAELEARLARAWDDHALRLLEEARERLAGDEAKVPGSERLYQRVLAGETPEEAHQAVYAGLYGEDDPEDDATDDGAEER